MGFFFYYMSIFVVGFVIGFFMVWRLGLVILVVVFVIVLVGVFYVYVFIDLVFKNGEVYEEVGIIVE